MISTSRSFTGGRARSEPFSPNRHRRSPTLPLDALHDFASAQQLSHPNALSAGRRQPSRLDKECLRKLYEFHKQLKAYIAAEEIKLELRNSSQPAPPEEPLDASPPSQHRPPTIAPAGGPAAAAKPATSAAQLQEMDLKVRSLLPPLYRPHYCSPDCSLN